MDILLFLLIGQLLVFGTFASDKWLKEDPKTKQAITADKKNETDLRGECVDIGYNNSGAPETFVTTGTSSDNSGEPACLLPTLVSNEMDREYSANDDSPDKEIPISNLKASVYNELGRSLEDPNTHDGLDSWWKYIVLKDDSLQISWGQLRAIENSESPGVELLNLLDDSGFTLADIEDLFMRHQMEGALSILRSRQRQTDDNDHCSSNPCKNEGTCIEEGDDYSCKCTHHWYSGKDCDKDDGPCETFCSERGTARCVYSGPGGTVTSCVCNAGYEGDKCDYFHDCAKNSLLTPLINICIERRMTNEECIRNATGIDKSVDSLDELVKRINNGDIQIPTIERNLRTFFGNLELFDLLGKLVSGSGGFDLGKEFDLGKLMSEMGKLMSENEGLGKLMSEIEGLGKLMSGIEGFKEYVHRGPGKIYDFHQLMSDIEGYKQQLQRQHQHSGDDGVDEVFFFFHLFYFSKTYKHNHSHLHRNSTQKKK